jgi:GNAT superfamily N-acetyltransferase
VPVKQVVMLMREIALRECREEDRAFIWDVRRQALRDYVAAMWGWDEAAQQERFEKGFTPAGHQVVVCDGTDVGLLQLVDGGDHLVVGKIALLPGFQRAGIGSELLGRILEQARARRILFASRCYARTGPPGVCMSGLVSWSPVRPNRTFRWRRALRRARHDPAFQEDDLVREAERR